MATHYTCFQGHSWPLADGSNICPVCGMRAIQPANALLDAVSEESSMRRTSAADTGDRPVSAETATDTKPQTQSFSPVALLLGVLLLISLAGVGVLLFLFIRQGRTLTEQIQVAREEANQESKRADKSAKEAAGSESEARREKDRAEKEKADADRETARERKRAADAESQAQFYLEQARRQTYTAQLARVEAIWEREPNRGREMLQDAEVCPPEYRDFAWGHLRKLCIPEAFNAAGHEETVTVLAVSPIDRIAASASDKTIKLWNLDSGKELATLKGHTQPIHGLLFSPDGSILASRCDNPGKAGELRLWDVAGRKEKANLTGHRVPVTGMAFTRDSKLFCSCSGESNNLNNTPMEVIVWDATTHEQKHSFRARGAGQAYMSLAVSPDGKLLAAGTGGTTQAGEIRVWELDSGKERTPLKGHTEWVTALGFSNDNKTLVSGSRESVVKLWELEISKERATLTGHTEKVEAVVLLGDGRQFASWTKNELRVWSIESGTDRITLSAPLPTPYSAAFSPDAQTIAIRTAGPERTAEITLWEIASGVKRTTFRVEKQNVEAILFSPDGRLLLSGWTDNRVRGWNVRSSQERLSVTAHTPGKTALAVSADGKWLATGSADKLVRLWDSTDLSRPVTSFKGHSEIISSLTFSKDGKVLVSADRTGKGGIIKFWDLEKQSEIDVRNNDNESSVTTVALSPDGDRLVWGNQSGHVKIASRSGKHPLKQLSHALSVNTLCFTPDGKYLAVGVADKSVKVWEVETEKVVHTLKGHNSSVNAVTVSPDGKTLATVAGEEYSPDNPNRPGELKIWDLSSGTEKARVRGRIQLRLQSVAFSPDGRTIATGGADKQVRLWDAQTGQQEIALQGHTQIVVGLHFSPDGKKLFSLGEDGMLKVWEAEQ